MKKIIVSTFLLFILCSCNTHQQDLIDVTKVQPWCILGFDTLERTPKQRIDLLKKLELSSYGYNKGKGHLDEMEEEFQLAKENNLEITSIFLWLNAERDRLGALSTYNQQMLKQLEKAPFKPTLWLSFSDNYFKKLNQEESIKLCIDMIQFVKTRADALGCKLALYNHRGWFGNPHNQVAILERLNDKSISMVYNFHHAHEYLDEFPEIATIIKPYLSHVNLNGMKKEGPEILTIGKGNAEYNMIRILQNEGFKGPWGILGHVKTEDVEKVLTANIEGLKQLNARYKKE